MTDCLLDVASRQTVFLIECLLREVNQSKYFFLYNQILFELLSHVLLNLLNSDPAVFILIFLKTFLHTLAFKLQVLSSNLDLLVQTKSGKSFQPIIIVYTRSDFVYLECTSTSCPMSYSLGFQLTKVSYNLNLSII